jgi:prepilin signal peptidase PulO-like enzyme (type II secretory pathway)
MLLKVNIPTLHLLFIVEVVLFLQTPIPTMFIIIWLLTGLLFMFVSAFFFAEFKDFKEHPERKEFASVTFIALWYLLSLVPLVAGFQFCQFVTIGQVWWKALIEIIVVFVITGWLMRQISRTGQLKITHVDYEKILGKKAQS